MGPVVISTHTVLAADDPTIRQSVQSPYNLGPLDCLVAPFIPIPVIFLYEQTADHAAQPLLDESRLTKALSLALDRYPHLTGRLRITKTSVPQIHEIGTGAQLVLATWNTTLATLKAVQPEPITLEVFPDGGNELLPAYDPDMTAVTSNPLVTVQLTRFACGGVALALRLLHVCCDAAGYFQFVDCLSSIYRELLKGDESIQPSQIPEPTKTPFLSEFVVDEHPPVDDERLNYEPALYYLEGDSDTTGQSSPPSELTPDIPKPAASETSRAPRNSSAVTGRFLRFSGQTLSIIKRWATDSSSGGWISTFDALSAHICQRIYFARLKAQPQAQARDPDSAPPPLSTPEFLTPINLRTRLLDFPYPHFSNALLCTVAQLSHEVLTGPLPGVAQAIHAITRTPAISDPGDIVRTVKWMAAQPDKGKIRLRFQGGSASIMASQWNKFDMYEYGRFDQRPSLVSSPFTPISLIDGLVYFFPTENQGLPEDKGDISVNLALSDPLWAFLDADAGFRPGHDNKAATSG